MKCHPKIIFILTFCCWFFAGSVDAADLYENWRLNEIIKLENGFLEKSAGDPYIVFPEISESTCAPMGIQLAITFDPVPVKPLRLEMFWSTDYLGFGEENKVFFIVHPHADGTANKMIIPLEHTAGFTQIRLDFPSYIDTTFKVENYEVLSLADVDDEYTKVDAYYSLSVEDSLKPEISIPYFLKALSHGPERMTHDLAFLVFWLLLIIGLLFLIRFTTVKNNVSS